MVAHCLKQIIFISKGSTEAILAKFLQDLGFTLKRFSTMTDYITSDKTRGLAVFFELDIQALQAKQNEQGKRVFDFIGGCKFYAEILFLYCAVNNLSPIHLLSLPFSFSVPVCYLPAPIDICLANQILEGDDNEFIKRHDLRSGAVLMQIYEQLSKLRHSLLWGYMGGITEVLRSLIKDPTEISSLMKCTHRKADGQLRAKALSEQYRREVDPLIDLLPENWATSVINSHKNVLSLTDNLSTSLFHLIDRQEDVMSLSAQILEISDNVDKYSELFKVDLYKFTEGIIYG